MGRSPEPHARERADGRADGRVGWSRSGDADAFDTLYRELAPELRAFAFRHVRSREAAVEIVHDVFLALWRGRDELEVRGGVRAYLYAATRNRALDWLAREEVRRRWGDREAGRAADVGAEVGADGVAEAVAEAERAEVLRAVLQAIEEMPERRRVVCSLRWREGRSLAEIALSLGISQKTVETQLSRGLKELRERFR